MVESLHFTYLGSSSLVESYSIIDTIMSMSNLSTSLTGGLNVFQLAVFDPSSPLPSFHGTHSTKGGSVGAELIAIQDVADCDGLS